MSTYLLSNCSDNHKSLILNLDNSNQQATMNQPECSFFFTVEKTTSVALMMSFSGAGLAICKFKTQEGDRTKLFTIDFTSVYYFICVS